MKRIVFGLLPNLAVADKVISELHQDMLIPADDMSYVYKNNEDEKVVEDVDDIAGKTAAEGAIEGATTGGVIGAAVGLVAATGVLGPIGAIVAAGPLATALGVTGALGAAAATGTVGAVAGGLIGVLANLGVSEPDARSYEEAIKAGQVLISVVTVDPDEVIEKLTEYHAERIIHVEEGVN